MNKKKYYFMGLSFFAILFLVWGYLGFKEPEPFRVIASHRDDGCKSEVEVYRKFIPVSTCQLEKQIEERTIFYPFSNIRITHFKHKRFHLDLTAYLDNNLQKGQLRFSSDYQDEKIVTKCDIMLETFKPFTVTMSLDDCENDQVDTFDLFFVYENGFPSGV